MLDRLKACLPFVHRSVDADDKTGNIMVKVIDNTVAAFMKYRNDASTAMIEKATALLAQAYSEGKRIELLHLKRQGLLHQAGMQSRAHGQNIVVEVVTAVV